MMKKSITIMIPAYNEEKYLENTVKMISKLVKTMFVDYEILIFDDYSSDRTGEIADTIAKKHPKIKVIHNKKNIGLGYNFRKGVKIAQEEYYCCIWADNDTPLTSIKTILEYTGDADLITSFVKNDKRPLYRRIVSRGFTNILNLLFNLHMKYYCGLMICKTELLKKVKMRTNSFAMQAEVIIQLIKMGHSYKEYSFISTIEEKTEESNMFRLKNIMGVLKTIIILFFEIHLRRKNKIGPIIFRV